jgi:hypothetical protein
LYQGKRTAQLVENDNGGKKEETYLRGKSLLFFRHWLLAIG